MTFINEDLFDNGKNIEIEKKYLINNKTIFDKIKECVTTFDKNIIIEPSNGELVKQVDYYYDTNDKILYKKDETLRIRRINDEKIITIKKPIKEDNGQRFEFEEKIQNEYIYDNKKFIIEHLPELKEYINNEELKNFIEIHNDRQKFTIKKNDMIFEMVFDNVSYSNNFNDKTSIKEDFEVEIELKSDYAHRIFLNELAAFLENELNINLSTKSKYKRAMNFIYGKI